MLMSKLMLMLIVMVLAQGNKSGNGVCMVGIIIENRELKALADNHELYETKLGGQQRGLGTIALPLTDYFV